MFSDEAEVRRNTQCKYLARREFLSRSLGIAEQELETCEFSADWIRRLGAQKVSLIFASSFMNSAGSSFGHTFLKLNNPKNEGALELTDYGINFAAKTSDTEGALYALKGLFGYFPGAFSMLPFHQMMKDYINLEGRDLWEYHLNLTPIEVRRLLYAVLELEGHYFDYYFLDDNCSFQIMKLLEIAKPELQLLGEDEFFVIPLDTVKRLRRSPGLITGEELRPSLQSQFRARLLEMPRSSLYKIKEIRSDKLDELNIDELELSQYYLALKQVDDSSVDYWRKAQDQVSRARARRSEKSSFNTEKLQLNQRLPENSPDSTSFGVGVFEKGSLRGTEISWRFAFHDLLENDAGAAKWSELEVLNFRFRRESSSQISYLEEGRIISMLSTSPVNVLFQPVSWGVMAGAFQNGKDLSHLSPLIQGKAGNSLDLYSSDLRWCLFAKGSVQEDPDLRVGAGIGAETFFLVQMGSRMRTQLGIEKLFFQNWELQATRVRGLLDLGANLELVAEFHEELWSSSQDGPRGQARFWTNDKLLRLQYQFLF
jgi:hypothetical protein